MPAVEASAGNTFFEGVRQQLLQYVSHAKLEPSADLILRVYQQVCGASLMASASGMPLRFSRLNYDGTPFQFAVTLGSARPALEFLSEAAPPDTSGVERIRAARKSIEDTAGLIGASSALVRSSALLDKMAPEQNDALLLDEGGAFWIGVSFPNREPPALIVYGNGRWGSERERWERLECMASHVGFEDYWGRAKPLLEGSLEPLGFALTLSGTSICSGRVYLSAYGKPVAWYCDLAERLEQDDLAAALRLFGQCLLGEDSEYPTQTAVCSLGFRPGSGFDFKFELCSHCLFSSDAEARRKILQWTERAHIDSQPYVDLLDTLSGGNVGESAADLHAYVGVGVRKGAIYTSVYLKPRRDAGSK